MNSLKKIFPISYQFKKDVGSVLLGMLIYLGIMVAVNVLFTVISSASYPVIYRMVSKGVTLSSNLPSIISSAFAAFLSAIAKFADIYVAIGVLIEVLLFANVIKSDEQ